MPSFLAAAFCEPIMSNAAHLVDARVLRYAARRSSVHRTVRCAELSSGYESMQKLTELDPQVRDPEWGLGDLLPEE
jgi:hypothetical protein